jgi:hypothetical protein
MKERKKMTDICHSITLLHEPLLKYATLSQMTMPLSKPSTNPNEIQSL